MYKLTNTSSIIRTTDGACIPADARNSDYNAYLEWARVSTNVAAAADVPSSASIKSANIKKIDADVDAIYESAIGNRATEYSEAEAQATAFKTAGYTGTVPAYVASWLSNNTKALTTATQAADDIIAQANAWRGAAASIRSNRLLAKKNLANDVSTAMASWNGFVTAIRGSLGI